MRFFVFENGSLIFELVYHTSSDLSTPKFKKFLFHFIFLKLLTTLIFYDILYLRKRKGALTNELIYYTINCNFYY